MEIFEILDGQLYQSGAPQDAAEWYSIHALGLDVVVDLFGTLDPGVPPAPNSILHAQVAMQLLGISGAEAVALVRRRPGALGNAVFSTYLESLPAPARAT